MLIISRKDRFVQLLTCYSIWHRHFVLYAYEAPKKVRAGVRRKGSCVKVTFPNTKDFGQISLFRYAFDGGYASKPVGGRVCVFVRRGISLVTATIGTRDMKCI